MKNNTNCTCGAYTAHECGCHGGFNSIVEVDLAGIKQNGLELDSPLLWALLGKGINFVCLDKDNDPLGFGKEPLFDGVFVIYRGGFLFNNENFYGLPLHIKINYTGEWKDSLTKRPKEI